jgi:hypothetical protein
MNDVPSDAGLCSDCCHVRVVRSGRGSVFLLCQRAASDPAFPRYPALPVRACPGHETAPATRSDG